MPAPATVDLEALTMGETPKPPLEALLPVDGLMPTPDESARLARLEVSPEPGPMYGYSFLLPAAWRMQQPPPGRIERASLFEVAGLGVFSPTTRMMPPIVVSFGVVLVPSGARVEGYYEAYCRHQGYEIVGLRPHEFFAGPVVDGLVSFASSAAGPITIRMAMFEDTGRLFILGGMAPAATYPDLVRVLGLAMVSFEPDFSSRR